MCGLKGAAKTDFESSVSQFTQQVTYISKLVGKTNDSLSSMSIKKTYVSGYGKRDLMAQIKK